MNKLVEHMIKHHNPGGNAINHVKVEQIIQETGWTREEILELARDPEAEHQLAPTMLRRDRDWSRDPTPEDLFAAGIWSKIYWKK